MANLYALNVEIILVLARKERMKGVMMAREALQRLRFVLYVANVLAFVLNNLVLYADKDLAFALNPKNLK